MERRWPGIVRSRFGRWRIPGLALALAGCSGFEQPVVRLDGIRVDEIGASGGTAVARLHVVNPNGFRLEATSLTYDLELGTGGEGDARNWISVADGVLREPVSVPGNDSTAVEVPVEFRYAGMSGVVRAFLNRGTLDYRVSGVIGVRQPVRRNVPFRRSGRVTLSEFAALRAGDANSASGMGRARH